MKHRERVLMALHHEEPDRREFQDWNGGLIIGPTHHVQLDTPLENFWAMVNTITQTPYSALS